MVKPKTLENIGTLRFLWKQSRLLPRELKKAKSQSAPQTVIDAYREDKSVIERIYGIRHLRSDLLYHGTGSLQYKGAKYDIGMTGILCRPLESILKNGLIPHTDPWALTQGSSLSVSFAKVWSYAKFYADVHQAPDDPLEWEFGRSVDWFSYCMVGTARQTLKTALTVSMGTLDHRKGGLRQALRTLHKTRKQNGSDNTYNRLQRWALDVRSDITPQASKLNVIVGKTDISGNFGAIITVSEKDVPLAPMGVGGTYEKRSARIVKPSKFTSLAVPLNKVEEYVAKVQGLGYTFPVLPIEVVEYHMSHFPIKKIASAQCVE